jgi:heat shock protein HslJ
MKEVFNFLIRRDSMKNLINNIFIIPLVLVLFAGLYSCGGSKTIESSKSNLPSGFYKVIALDQSQILEDHPTLNFDLTQSRVSGRAGCNDYSGTLVQAEINSSSFTLESILTTKMYCSDAVMAVEFKFLKHLGQPMGWQHKGDTLSLFTDQPQASIVAVKTIEQ